MSATRPPLRGPSSHHGPPTRRRHLLIAFAALLLLFAASSATAICGDCEVDGDVDIVDALIIAQSVPTISGPRMLDCDVNGNGTLDVLDALIVAQIAAGIMPPPATNCRQCGDCDLNSTTFDAGDLALLPPLGGAPVPVTTTGQAACDTDGNGVLDTADRLRWPLAGSPSPSCTTCGDCAQDTGVTTVDRDRAAAGTVPVGRATTACDIMPSPLGSVDILDAFLIASYLAGPPGSTLTCHDPTAVSP